MKTFETATLLFTEKQSMTAMGSHTEETDPKSQVAIDIEPHGFSNSKSKRSLHSCIPSEDRVKGQNERKVHFSKVDIRQYERIMGDHPNAMNGPAISIGWRYSQQPSCLLDDFENTRKENESREKESAGNNKKGIHPKRLQPLEGYIRRNMCLHDFKISEEEITNAMKESEKIQRQRVKSFRRQEAIENVMNSPFVLKISKTIPWLQDRAPVSEGSDSDSDSNNNTNHQRGARNVSRTFRGGVLAVIFGVSTLSKARATISEQDDSSKIGDSEEGAYEASAGENATKNQEDLSNANSEKSIEAKVNGSHNKHRGAMELSRMFRGAVQAVVFSSRVRKTSSTSDEDQEGQGVK